MHLNGMMLYLPLTDAIEYSANGTALERDRFAIFEPGSEACISTKGAHDWGTIFVPTPMLSCREPREPVSPTSRPTVRVSRVDHQSAVELRAVFRQIMTAASHSQKFESSPAAACAAAELLKVTSAVLQLPVTGMTHPSGRPRLPRQEIIARSCELLEQREGETVRVGELATAADVTERTLRTAYREYFGVGPVRYLQLRRLHQVRRTLRALDPDEITVTNALVRYGEWEFGRFASRYHRLFGELPSETLRGKSR
jgi:AraC family ethanolamine operon transcriptional activator